MIDSSALGSVKTGYGDHPIILLVFAVKWPWHNADQSPLFISKLIIYGAIAPLSLHTFMACCKITII